MISRCNKVALHLNDMVSRYNKVALHLNDTSNNKLIAPNCNTYSTQESTSARRKPSGPRVADPYTEEDRFDLYLILNQSARETHKCLTITEFKV